MVGPKLSKKLMIRAQKELKLIVEENMKLEIHVTYT